MQEIIVKTTESEQIRKSLTSETEKRELISEIKAGMESKAKGAKKKKSKKPSIKSNYIFLDKKAIKC